MHEEKKRRRARNNAGFTLVELMVVVAIIAILATIAGFKFMSALGTADTTKAMAEIKALKTAVTAYMLKNQRKLPDSLDQVAEFMENDKIPDDPWGYPYQYTKEGSRDYFIVSYGADNAPGGDEDNADISSRDF